MSNDMISRSALLATLDELFMAALRKTGDSVETIYNLEHLAMLVENAPAIDAEPVRHGRWVESDTEEFLGFRTQWMKCSECGKEHASESITVKHGKYCPWCGAKMDLEVQG